MKTIPYGHQWIGQDDVKQVMMTLRSDWITQGPKIAAFESALCVYTGAKYAVAVSSGTAALHIAALAAGIEPRDEIITSAITFAASANCALYCKAKPVFADVDPETANTSAAEIAKKITKRTKAIIPVHFAGYPCEMKDIAGLARRKKLLIIEDAAHALGARYKGSIIGSCRYSDMTILSFHPVKAITSGEGGAVLTNNRTFYQRMLLFRNHGITKDPAIIGRAKSRLGWYYTMQELGFNYRLTDIQAALGISQLRKLGFFIEKRRKAAAIYKKAFQGNSFFEVPEEEKGIFNAYHLYPIRVKSKLKAKRNQVFEFLRRSGIGVQVHYIPVYLHPYYRALGYKKGMCPVAEDFSEKEISLPMYAGLSDKDIKYVIKTVFTVFKRLNHG